MNNIVIVESPFAGATKEEEQANIEYGRACLRDSLLRGEVPFASHLIYALPGVLNDNSPVERKIGMEAGFQYYTVATKSVVYIDRGISRGMREGIERAKQFGVEVEYRTLNQ